MYNIGDKIDDIVVLQRDFTSSFNSKIVRYNCKCSICGREKSMTSQNLKLKHGTMHKACSQLYRKKYPKLYYTWQRMVQRCTNPKDNRYKDYGGRGILTEFLLFIDFVDYMLPSYLDKKKTFNDSEITLDRIDGSKGYIKDNIRWATPKEQAINRFTTVKVIADINGKVLKFESQKECELYFHISHKTIKKYLNTNIRYKNILFSSN